MASTDEKMPDVGALIVIMRGRMCEREIASYSELGPKLTKLDPIEDRQHLGSIWRVLSLSAWPLALCALEWHPSAPASEAQTHAGDALPYSGLRLPSPLEAWMQSQAAARAAADARTRYAEKVRGIIDMHAVKWRQVPQSHLDAARND